MIRFLAIILTSVTLPFATLPLLPYICNLTVVGPMNCLIFERDERMIGYPAITKTTVTLPNITLPCIFQNRVCVFFSMDKWIFGCLTTYAYDLGGTQEVSNF